MAKEKNNYDLGCLERLRSCLLGRVVTLQCFKDASLVAAKFDHNWSKDKAMSCQELSVSILMH